MKSGVGAPGGTRAAFGGSGGPSRELEKDVIEPALVRAVESSRCPAEEAGTPPVCSELTEPCELLEPARGRMRSPALSVVESSASPACEVDEPSPLRDEARDSLGVVLPFECPPLPLLPSSFSACRARASARLKPIEYGESESFSGSTGVEREALGG
jgi:hypothetical protein